MVYLCAIYQSSSLAMCIQDSEASPSRPVGRGRGILKHLVQPDDEVKEEAKKKERKLKKMLKQVLCYNLVLCMYYMCMLVPGSS